MKRLQFISIITVYLLLFSCWTSNLIYAQSFAGAWQLKGYNNQLHFSPEGVFRYQTAEWDAYGVYLIKDDILVMVPINNPESGLTYQIHSFDHDRIVLKEIDADAYLELGLAGEAVIPNEILEKLVPQITAWKQGQGLAAEHSGQEQKIDSPTTGMIGTWLTADGKTTETLVLLANGLYVVTWESQFGLRSFAPQVGVFMEGDQGSLTLISSTGDVQSLSITNLKSGKHFRMTDQNSGKIWDYEYKGPNQLSIAQKYFIQSKIAYAKTTGDWEKVKRATHGHLSADQWTRLNSYQAELSRQINKDKLTPEMVLEASYPAHHPGSLALVGTWEDANGISDKMSFDENGYYKEGSDDATFYKPRVGLYKLTGNCLSIHMFTGIEAGKTFVYYLENFDQDGFNLPMTTDYKPRFVKKGGPELHAHNIGTIYSFRYFDRLPKTRWVNQNEELIFLEQSYLVWRRKGMGSQNGQYSTLAKHLQFTEISAERERYLDSEIVEWTPRRMVLEDENGARTTYFRALSAPNLSADERKLYITYLKLQQRINMAASLGIGTALGDMDLVWSDAW